MHNIQMFGLKKEFRLASAAGSPRDLVAEARSVAFVACHTQYCEDKPQKGVVLEVGRPDYKAGKENVVTERFFFTPSDIAEALSPKTVRSGQMTYTYNPFSPVLSRAVRELSEYGAPVPKTFGL